MSVCPEAIAKMAASKRGVLLSAEHRAKLSIAQKARRERERYNRVP